MVASFRVNDHPIPAFTIANCGVNLTSDLNILAFMFHSVVLLPVL
jgi:hypothetical protein